MTIVKDKVVPWPGRPGVLLYDYHSVSEVSYRNAKGQLLLREWPHHMEETYVASLGGTDSDTSCPGAETNNIFSGPWPVNEAYSRLTGKIRGGGASLGVSIASMSQSMDMIVSRFDQVNAILERALLKKRKLLTNKFATKHRANDILEYEFGWKPFIDDISNSLAVIADHGVKKDTRMIGAKVRVNVNPASSRVYGAEPRFTETISGKAWLTAKASYNVTNPNIWLMNRLGLLNPFQIAWDRVPWSWVVNMFVNANQLISSVTDTMGLDLNSGSVTRTYNVLREVREEWRLPPWQGWRYFTNTTQKQRDRVGRFDLKPTLEFKLPKFNLELGVIASSLAVQRADKITKLLKKG